MRVFASVAVFSVLTAMSATGAEPNRGELLKGVPTACEIHRALSRTLPSECAAATLKKRGLMVNPDAIKSFQEANIPAGQVNLMINFDLNSANLTPQARQIVAEVAKVMRDQVNSGEHFEIIGHTDITGTPEYNYSLSKDRANAVVAELARVDGVNPEVLVPTGKGPSELYVKERPTDALNRRVEFVRVR